MEDLNKQLEEARLDLEYHNIKLKEYVDYKKGAEQSIEVLNSRVSNCNEWIGRYQSSVENSQRKIEKLISGMGI